MFCIVSFNKIVMLQLHCPLTYQVSVAEELKVKFDITYSCIMFGCSWPYHVFRL